MTAAKKLVTIAVGAVDRQMPRCLYPPFDDSNTPSPLNPCLPTAILLCVLLCSPKKQLRTRCMELHRSDCGCTSLFRQDGESHLIIGMGSHKLAVSVDGFPPRTTSGTSFGSASVAVVSIGRSLLHPRSPRIPSCANRAPAPTR